MDEKRLNQENQSITETSKDGNLGSVSATKIRKGKVILVASLILVLTCVGGLVWIFFSNDKGSSKLAENINTEITAYFDTEGVAYLPLMNGQSVNLGSDVFDARVSPDRLKIVFLLNDKTLQWMNSEKTQSELVSNDAIKIVDVYDDGIIYRGANEAYYRYLFSRKESEFLGKIDGFYAFDSCSNLLIAYDNGIFKVNSEGSLTKLTSYNGTYCRFLESNKDATFFLWEEKSSEQYKIFSCTDGDKSTVAKVDSRSFISCIMNKSRTYAVIYDSYEKNFYYIINKGEEPIEVKMGSKVSFAQSQVINDDSKKFPGLYTCEYGYLNKELHTLYYIDSDGDDNAVISDIGAYSLSDKYVYYIDKNDNLREARIKRGEASGDKKIAGNVSVIFVNNYYSGDYVYFLKDLNASVNTGLLCVYHNGKTVEISENAFFGSVSISNDGRSICYFEGQTIDSGSLYRYTYGESESIKVGDQVLHGSITSHKTNGYQYCIDVNAFTYKVVASSDKTSSGKIADLYYYDGNESVLVAKNVRTTYINTINYALDPKPKRKVTDTVTKSFYSYKIDIPDYWFDKNQSGDRLDEQSLLIHDNEGYAYLMFKKTDSLLSKDSLKSKVDLYFDCFSKIDGVSDFRRKGTITEIASPSLSYAVGKCEYSEIGKNWTAYVCIFSSEDKETDYRIELWVSTDTKYSYEQSFIKMVDSIRSA